MESNTRNAPVETQEDARRNTQASITITSHRKHSCDVDGISAKAIIDGLVHCGVLEDDGPRHVKEVRYRQEKVAAVEEEKTVVEIEWG